VDDVKFRPPDFGSPVDVEAELGASPADAQIKGVIIGNVADQLRRAGHAADRYSLFRDYPMAAYIRLTHEAAVRLFPDVAVKEALRRIGHGHYDAFKGTTLGRMVFGVLGRNMASVLQSSPKGYKYTTSASRTRVVWVDKSSQEAIVRLIGLPYMDSVQVGVYEGGLCSTGHTGEVHVARDDDEGLLLRIRWV